MDGPVTHGHAVIEDVVRGKVTPICRMDKNQMILRLMQEERR